MAFGRRLRMLTLAGATLFAVVAWPASAAQPFKLLLKFGVSGSAPGQLNSPTRLVTDRDGKIYVEENGNNRISVFGPSGHFKRLIGSSGAGAGQLASPFGTSLGPNGKLYVAEQDNNRISEFTTGGSFIRAWGFDVIPGGGGGLEVCNETTDCKTGVLGSEAGQLDEPSGTAEDAAGHVFVGEQSDARVDEFTASGAFVRGWGYNVNPSGGSGDLEVCTGSTGCQAGVSGSGPGQLNDPTGVRVDKAGHLWVADTDNNRINVYTTSGSFRSSFGGLGGGAGKLNEPTDIAFDRSGNAYVNEQGGNRVSEFNSHGHFIRAFGVGVIDGANKFQVCTKSTGCQLGLDSGFGALGAPEGVSVDCRGAVYVTDYDNNHVERFGSPGTHYAPCPSNHFTFGKVKLNRRNGSAKLTVKVPGPGSLKLKGRQVKPTSQHAASAGAVKLKVRANGNAKRKLKQTGAVKVRAKVTFTPSKGDPRTKSTTIGLKKQIA
jgi:tripartite motif-containing protein 71